MVQISRAEGMHNDIIGEVVEVDMLEVVDKEDIALLRAAPIASRGIMKVE